MVIFAEPLANLCVTQDDEEIPGLGDDVCTDNRHELIGAQDVVKGDHNHRGCTAMTVLFEPAGQGTHHGLGHGRGLLWPLAPAPSLVEAQAASKTPSERRNLVSKAAEGSVQNPFGIAFGPKVLGPHAEQSVEFEDAVRDVASGVAHPHEELLDLPGVPSHGLGLECTIAQCTQNSSLTASVNP